MTDKDQIRLVFMQDRIDAFVGIHCFCTFTIFNRGGEHRAIGRPDFIHDWRGIAQPDSQLVFVGDNIREVMQKIRSYIDKNKSQILRKIAEAMEPEHA